jgi:hypothetical protein
MKVNIPKDYVPAIDQTVKTIDYDYVCNDRKVLPHLKQIVSAGAGTAKVKAFPAELVARLNQAFEQRTDEAVISEMPKYFPGSRVILVNDSPDFIAEGGAFKEQLVELYTAAKDISTVKGPAVYYHHNELGWLIVAVSSEVKLKDLTEFIEVNTDRWAELANCDQLPGGGNEAKRQFPVSALPGTEEAKRVIKPLLSGYGEAGS